MKKAIALTMAALMLVGSITGCSNSTSSSSSGSSSQSGSAGNLSEMAGNTEKLSADENPLVTDKDTVVISLASDLESLDPIVISTIVTNEVMSNAYEALVSYDLEGNVTPGIATDWSYDEATMTYTINLRDDVYFHDGTQLTADDVAFSLELGKQTGRMAARVLNGENAGEIPFEIIADSYLYVNEGVMAEFGLTLPEDLQARAIVVDAESAE